MSNVARGNDGLRHYADKSIHDPYAGPYFCPGCNVEMILKNIGPASKDKKAIAPYFSSTPGAGHQEGCEYASVGKLGRNLNADDFSLDSLFSHIQKPGGTVQKTAGGAKRPAAMTIPRITTLGRFYAFCRTHDIDYTFPDGTKLWHIFQDERSEKLPFSKRKPLRAIMLNFINCNFERSEVTDSYNIWCYRPHEEIKKPPAIDAILRFSEENLCLMHEWCKVLTPLKRKRGNAPLVIVVIGEWKGKSCEITSKRQVYLVRGELSHLGE